MMIVGLLNKKEFVFKARKGEVNKEKAVDLGRFYLRYALSF